MARREKLERLDWTRTRYRTSIKIFKHEPSRCDNSVGGSSPDTFYVHSARYRFLNRIQCTHNCWVRIVGSRTEAFYNLDRGYCPSVTKSFELCAQTCREQRAIEAPNCTLDDGFVSIQLVWGILGIDWTRIKAN